ncbi:MAG: hypothetical protein ABW167_07730 [Baekduia sp.]
MTAHLTSDQIEAIKSNVLSGQPLYLLSVCWGMPEGGLLAIAQISRAEHERRRVRRVVVCKEGLDAAAADAAVKQWAEQEPPGHHVRQSTA